MGRTLPTITDALRIEQGNLNGFRRALRRSDQRAMDDLLIHVRKHLAAVSCAEDALPMEMFLLSMLIEEHKTIQNLQYQIEALQAQLEQFEQDQQVRGASAEQQP